MSAPPSDGVTNPWPLEREKYLHTPVNTGPSDARAVLHRKHITERGMGDVSTEQTDEPAEADPS